MERQTDCGFFEYLDDAHPLHDNETDDDKKSRTRKRRRPTRTAPVHVHVPLDLTISGVKCALHRNDSMAMKIDEGKHLMDYFENNQEVLDSDPDQESDIPRHTHAHTNTSVKYTADDWKDIVHVDDENEDDSSKVELDVDESWLNRDQGSKKSASALECRPVLLMDRFDVRGMLEHVSAFDFDKGLDSSNTKKDLCCRKRDDDLPEEEQNLLELERYGDLFMKLQEEDAKFKEEKLRPAGSAKNTENRQAMSHVGTEKDHFGLPLSKESASISNNTTISVVGFKLEEKDRMSLPDGFQIPASQRQLDIIEMSANKSKEIPQFEVLLKVKQQKNPDFFFLNSDDILYPFYQWVKDGKPNLRAGDKEILINKEGVGNNRSGAIGILAMYGSSSSDDEEDGQVNSDQPTTKEGPGSDTTRIPVNSSASSQADSSEMVSGNNDNNEANPVTVSVRHAPASTEEQKAQRLKRAKMLRNHFLARNKE